MFTPIRTFWAQVANGFFLLTSVLTLGCRSLPAADWVTYDGQKGAGQGKQIVFLSGDEEYRSEEGLPMLAKILAERHGFKCTVLFALNPSTGEIDPNNQTNVVGWEHLGQADLVVMLLRFREPSDDKMKYFVDFLHAGKPVIGLRTSTHSFSYERNKSSPYFKFDWRSKEWTGGFGQQVLGDTWVSHHGNHGSESTRGVIYSAQKDHPILRGVTDVWGPTDVYGVVHLPADAVLLLQGQVLSGMNPDSTPVVGKKNDPMMPLAWAREYRWENGKSSRIVCTTMGAASDLQSEGLRRLLVNSCYWGLKMEKDITDKLNVEMVGDYHPTAFGFGKFRRGLKPADFQ